MIQREAPGAVDPEAQKKRLAALVREYGAQKIEREPSNTVLVWPNLLVIEFLAAALVTLGLVVLGIIMDSPLEDHANPDVTPNPSKAPWYFLNLQELLLHMHPALAGVIVPTVALLVLAMVPYIDNVVGDTGIWFSTPTGKKCAVVAAIYTLFLVPILILFDNFVGVKPAVAAMGFDRLGLTEALAGWIIPIVLMVGLPAIMVVMLRPLRPSRRDVLIALFTGFVVSYLLLTISGTAFRGEGMKLYWPWQIGLPIE